MRKMRDSSNTACRVWFSSRADARSRPNGFSTTTPPSEAPIRPSPCTTVSNRLGGIAR